MLLPRERKQEIPMASTTNTVNAIIIISSLPAQTQLFPDRKRKNPNPFQSSDLSNVAPQVGLELGNLLFLSLETNRQMTYLSHFQLLYFIPISYLSAAFSNL